MKQILSPGLVKNSLSSHSWVGLLAGGLIYLICLSGTLAVFYPAFERWEQPQIAEGITLRPEQLQNAYETALRRTTEGTGHMYIGLPNGDMPRTSIASDHGGWWLNRDGSLGERVDHEWTHLLIKLHTSLLLPQTVGIVMVSTLGVLLISLIVSGFLAHPRIFRDAFTLRLKGNKHLEQADIHNRLSVWGAPFHLMIAITGAYFGLASIIGLVLAQALFDGDKEAIVPTVFGEKPALEQSEQTAQVGSALRQMPELAPNEHAFYITVENVGTAEQFLVVGTEVPGRLVYAEKYHFDAAGNYLGKVGTSDGEAGRQTVFSVYRLHFGHFGGLDIRLLYVLFGLALTVVSTTGINIWLARRKHRDALNHLWVGGVWGAPLALSLSAVAQIGLQFHSPWLFWFTLAGCTALSAKWRDENRSKRRLLAGNAAVLVTLVTVHSVRFGTAALNPTPLTINLALLACAAVMLWRAGKPAHEALPNHVAGGGRGVI